MNKGLKSAGWLLIVVALIQSAADLTGGALNSAAADGYAVAEVGGL